MPSRVLRGTRHAAMFDAGSGQFLDWTALLEAVAGRDPGRASCFSGPHTVIVVAALSTVAAAALLDITRAGGARDGLGANRSTLLAIPGKSTWTFRQGGFSVDADDGVMPVADEPQLLIGRAGDGIITLNRNHGGKVAVRRETVSAPPDIVTVGARNAIDGVPLFLSGAIWKALVFEREISDAEVLTHADWSTDAFGTP
jgi:hypothetical protein